MSAHPRRPPAPSSGLTVRRRARPVSDRRRGESKERGRNAGHSRPRRPAGWLRSLFRVRSVGGQVFLLQAVVTVLVVAAALVVLVLQAQHNSTREARLRSMDIAKTFAYSPDTSSALAGPDPARTLQPLAERIRRGTGVDLVVVFSPDGVRYAHPDPSLIGTLVPAPHRPVGAPRTDAIETSEGLSEVSFVPVTGADGTVLGSVAVGITVQKVASAAAEQLPVLLGTAAGAVALSAGGTALVSRRLLRQTRGLGPEEMTRMYDHHDAVLHAVREGVLITEDDGRLVLANDEALRLLNLPPDAEQRDVGDLGLDPGIVELLLSEETVTDEVRLSADRLLAINKRRTAPGDGRARNVVTLRDTTELRKLSGRAEMARERLTLLYDAGSRIGSTLDVVHTARELADVAVPRFADLVTVKLAEEVLRGEEPSGVPTGMCRVALSSVYADQPPVAVGERIPIAADMPQARCMKSGRAVLETGPGAAETWRTLDAGRTERALDDDIHSLLAVPLRARGTILGVVDFWRSRRAESFDESDVPFAEELAAWAAVALDNARRYTREHTMAVTLQRSLLPRGLPELSALDVAHRYLPARAGVGGDWFDVIELSGARVALVVGDVVGHGLHAAATMGRLRTAVHNFATLDLPPDELLARLDDLVARLDREQVELDDEETILGATCLYVIYDPASGTCSMARAGHPPPAVVRPDSTVTFPDLPAGPPLGLGGLPFEAAEVQVPEGSRLVLYTDGLIEKRGRDLDVGLALLQNALSQPDLSPEQTCRAVLDALPPDHASDDIALLVARTRVLGTDQVAGWGVSREASDVSRVRADVSRQLEAWGLTEVGFATELILSELVTNAICYGSTPIHVRLLRDRHLICEVSDGSSTSPHLRYAATTDEGGRGLFLVARYAERWGTRYTATGKVIWTEQLLDGGRGEPEGTLSDDDLLAQWSDAAL